MKAVVLALGRGRAAAAAGGVAGFVRRVIVAGRAAAVSSAGSGALVDVVEMDRV